MARFRLYMMGHFVATLDDQPITTFRSDKARALLSYVVLGRERVITRTHLTELLWPGYSATTARASLRVTFSNLRQVIAPLLLLHANYKMVQFWSQHPQFWCDVLALENALHNDTLPPDLNLTHFQTGDFMRGFEEIDSAPFNCWLQERRTYYDQVLEQLLERTAVTRKSFVLAGNLDLAPPLAPPSTAQPEPVVVFTNGVGSPARPPVKFPPAPILNQAPDLGLCLGRTAELHQLEQWIVTERSRLVVLLGMGGQGKTTLAATLAQQLVTQPVAGHLFTIVLWHSLVNAPPLAEVLSSWLRHLAEQQSAEVPKSLDEQVDLLLDLLHRQHALLILDNVESIMLAGERAGYYRPGYEGYGQLFYQVATSRHQSCLLLTSREEPHELKQLEVGATRCHTLRLTGLIPEAGQNLLAIAGLTVTVSEAAQLVAHYSGNPLALKLIAATIHELFASNIQLFLATGPAVFDDIRDVLDQQCNRLSDLERALLYWLAIEREPVTLETLQANLVEPQLQWALLEATRSLGRRSLVEHHGNRLGLQNVITEYISERLVTTIIDELLTANCQSINSGSVEAKGRQNQTTNKRPLAQTHFNHYTLVKAQVKEYVRLSQVQLLLQPVAEALMHHWGVEPLTTHMQVLLHRLRFEAPLAPGYAATNILHLLLHLQIDLRSYDFSRLTLWQVDLRKAELRQVNLSQADLSGAVFLEPFQIVDSVCFSHHGQWLVTGTGNGEIQLWRLADQQLTRVFKGHTGPVYSVAFSPDDSYLVSAGADSTIRIYDTATGEVQLCLRGHSDEVICVRLNHAKKLVTSISYDGSLKVWDIRTQAHGAQPLHSFPLYAPKIVYMPATAIAPDGTMAVVAVNQQIHCWAISSGQQCCILEGHTGMVRALVISPDGCTLASASEDHTIRLWDLSPPALKNGRGQTPRLLATLDSFPIALAFSGDGSTLASASENHTIRVWKVPTGQLCHLFTDHETRVSALAFNSMNVQLASVGYDETIRLRDTQSGQTEAVWHGRSQWLERVIFSPDNQTLAGIYFDCAIRVWDCTGQLLATLQGHKGPPRHLAYSPDGKTLVSGSDDKTIRVWQLPNGQHRHTIRGHLDRISGLAFHPGGSLVVSLGHDQKVHLWDVATGAHLGQAEGHTQPVFSPDGAVLGFLDSKSQVNLWQLDRNQPYTLPWLPSSVCALAFHPQQPWLATASTTKTICLWNLTHGCLLASVVTSVEAHRLLFSATGETLVTVNADQTLGLWTVAVTSGELQLCHVLHGHIYNPYCIAFSPDGALLVSGNVNGCVQIWDVQTGQCLQTLVGHDYLITTVDFSPDGCLVASGSSNGDLRLWDVQTGECLQILRPAGPYQGTNITGVTGITAAQKAALKALGAVEG